MFTYTGRLRISGGNLLTTTAILGGGICKFKIAQWLIEVDFVIETEVGDGTGSKQVGIRFGVGVGSRCGKNCSGDEPKYGRKRNLHYAQLRVFRETISQY
jgi:hypothetical protein